MRADSYSKSLEATQVGTCFGAESFCATLSRAFSHNGLGCLGHSTHRAAPSLLNSVRKSLFHLESRFLGRQLHDIFFLVWQLWKAIRLQESRSNFAKDPRIGKYDNSKPRRFIFSGFGRGVLNLGANCDVWLSVFFNCTGIKRTGSLSHDSWLLVQCGSCFLHGHLHHHKVWYIQPHGIKVADAVPMSVFVEIWASQKPAKVEGCAASLLILITSFNPFSNAKSQRKDAPSHMGLLDASIEVVLLLCDAGFKFHHIYLWKEKVFKRQPLGRREEEFPVSSVLIPILGAGKQAQ